MLRALFFTLLTLIATPACSECALTDTSYANSGGGETSTTLMLHTNNTFTLMHKTWQPGHYDKQKKSISKGNWSCNHEQLTLKINDNALTAKITTVGSNPLGINEKAKALSFGPNTITTLDYLANEILYPKSLVSD